MTEYLPCEQKELEEKYEREKRAIEERFEKQLLEKSEELDQELTKERNQRVEVCQAVVHILLLAVTDTITQELADYRAQLKALNNVLERTSIYEALSHQVTTQWLTSATAQTLRLCLMQVHKASMAALALSDRIEAAAPLRAEVGLTYA